MSRQTLLVTMLNETEQPDNRELTVGEEQSSRVKKWPRKAWIALSLLGLGIAAAIIVFYITRPASKSASDSIGKTRAAQSVGNEVKLYIKGRDTIMVAADEKTLDQLITAFSARNGELEALIQSGRVLTVPNGTRARIVEKGYGKTKVRIIEGDRILSEGWVPELWVW